MIWPLPGLAGMRPWFFEPVGFLEVTVSRAWHERPSLGESFCQLWSCLTKHSFVGEARTTHSSFWQKTVLVYPGFKVFCLATRTAAGGPQIRRLELPMPGFPWILQEASMPGSNKPRGKKHTYTYQTIWNIATSNIPMFLKNTIRQDSGTACQYHPSRIGMFTTEEQKTARFPIGGYIRLMFNCKSPSSTPRIPI